MMQQPTPSCYAPASPLRRVRAVAARLRPGAAGPLAWLCLVLALTAAGELRAQGPDIRVKKKAYTLLIRPEGFRYALQAKGQQQVAFHPVSGLRFSAPGDTSLYDAASTEVLSRQADRLECLVTN